MPLPSTLNTTMLGQQVPIAKVYKALRELWADETGRTRASLMNFAIYSEDPVSLEQNTLMLDALTQEHSCRALLVLNCPGATPATPTAWVTAHCQLSNGRRSVCCEQLSFVMEGGSADQVRNTVFAHLDSDLPLVVWWQGECIDRLDERFVSVIDSLFIDSSKSARPVAYLKKLLELRMTPTARFSLSDLAWMRSHFMRTALASAFQSRVIVADLPKFNRLNIVHGEGHQISAQMLAAWIGTQLKCVLGNGPGITLCRPDGTAIEVVIEAGASACALQVLRFSGPDITITVERVPSSSFVHAKIDHPLCQRDDVQPADLDSDADLIAEQLSRLGGTTRYFEMMPLLLALLER